MTKQVIILVALAVVSFLLGAYLMPFVAAYSTSRSDVDSEKGETYHSGTNVVLAASQSVTEPCVDNTEYSQDITASSLREDGRLNIYLSNGTSCVRDRIVEFVPASSTPRETLNNTPSCILGATVVSTSTSRNLLLGWSFQSVKGKQPRIEVSTSRDPKGSYLKLGTPTNFEILDLEKKYKFLSATKPGAYYRLVFPGEVTCYAETQIKA